MACILLTGIAGGLAQGVALRLLRLGHEVVGVDYRATAPFSGPLSAVKLYRASYNKTAIEDVFRHHAFDTVLHLGRVGNLKESFGKRFDLNVIGSQKIMDLCLSHQVKRLVVLSTFHIYGAHPNNHTPIYEGEPLRAGAEFPQLADAIQLDNMASLWVYKHSTVRSVVIRACNVIGEDLQNTMSKILRMKHVPYVIGYNPMTQFIHADDVTDALVRAAFDDSIGVFNLCGPTAIPWRTALEFARVKGLPLPPVLGTKLVQSAFGLPGYLLNFLQYPCVLSDSLFRQTFQWEPQVPIDVAIQRTVLKRA